MAGPTFSIYVSPRRCQRKDKPKAPCDATNAAETIPTTAGSARSAATSCNPAGPGPTATTGQVQPKAREPVRPRATAAAVDTAISGFAAKLGSLGTNSKSLERQLTFTSKIQDAVEVGIGNLVDADLAKESAKLTALQTKQQLGVQALSIANQSSGMLLGLFR